MTIFKREPSWSAMHSTNGHFIWTSISIFRFFKSPNYHFVELFLNLVVRPSKLFFRMHLRPPYGQKSNLKICQKIFSSIIPDEDDQHQSLAPITLTRQHKGAIRAIRKVRFLLIMQKKLFLIIVWVLIKSSMVISSSSFNSTQWIDWLLRRNMRFWKRFMHKLHLGVVHPPTSPIAVRF